MQNGVIVHSDLLLEYLAQRWPGLYFVSSTTKVLTDFRELKSELDREDFSYVVPDFRLNRQFDALFCPHAGAEGQDRISVQRVLLVRLHRPEALLRDRQPHEPRRGLPEHRCAAPDAGGGYRFSKAMKKNPGFIGVRDIEDIYLPMGFSNFKIEGRSLGSALILEFLLHYMARPEYQLNVREEIYLDNTLDLF